MGPEKRYYMGKDLKEVKVYIMLSRKKYLRQRE